MPEPGDGSRTNVDAALAALPPTLAAESLTPSRIMMPKAPALEAIDLLAAQGRTIENWEGWVKLRDGGRAKSLTHAGSFALPRDAQRAAATARAGIEAAQARWDRDPEYPNAVLYFALTFAAI